MNIEKQPVLTWILKQKVVRMEGALGRVKRQTLALAELATWFCY
jgi:hypothetical protein